VEAHLIEAVEALLPLREELVLRAAEAVEGERGGRLSAWAREQARAAALCAARPWLLPRLAPPGPGTPATHYSDILES
jgi:hypothetical protein